MIELGTRVMQILCDSPETITERTIDLTKEPVLGVASGLTPTFGTLGFELR